MSWNNDPSNPTPPSSSASPWRPVAPGNTPQSPFPAAAPQSVAPRYQAPATPSNIAALSGQMQQAFPQSHGQLQSHPQPQPQAVEAITARPLAPVTASMPAAFPTIPADGAPVDANFYVEPWTNVLVYAGYAVLAGFALIAVLATFGVALLLGGVLAIVGYFLRQQAYSMIRGSGIQVTPHQLPEIYRAVQTFSQRLGMAQAPEVYIIEANVMNAATVKLGKSGIVLLTDDLIEAALRTQNVDALSFVLAHELSHIALGHTGILRTILRANLYLSRWDEYSVDGAAMALTSPDAAIRGLVLLTTGPGLLRYINPQAIQEQVRTVWNDKNALRAERKTTHPLPLRRMGRLYQRIGA